MIRMITSSLMPTLVENAHTDTHNRDTAILYTIFDTVVAKVQHFVCAQDLGMMGMPGELQWNL